jgi:lipopolysaccharide/colanic/teichoic acid biosynthesis glycosyltransferase
MDALLSALLLLLVLPLLLLLAALVRLTSPGPALFRQERVGRDGRLFVMHKLRTMHVGMPDDIHRAFVIAQIAARSAPPPPGGLHKIEQDPRVTAIGSFLRRTSLDELPQLWDVLRGDMSLVGPRPVLPWEADLLTPVEQERFQVRPGITGLWQVSGRSRLSMPQAFELDVQYARGVTFLRDLVILLRTVGVVFRPGGSAR